MFNMEEQVLSIEQMRELQELGIDTYKASMCWYHYYVGMYTKGWECLPKDIEDYVMIPKIDSADILERIPTFTLQDILEMLPRTINYDGSKRLRIVPPNEIEYTNYSLEGHFTYGESLLDAAFNMLKWVKQNNYI